MDIKVEWNAKVVKGSWGSNEMGGADIEELDNGSLPLGVEYRPLFGVMGWPVRHSLSPRMHNYCFRKLGIPGVYVHFEVAPEGLKAAVEGARALGIAGFNVTVPHKRTVMEYLDEVDPDAELIGAVNTVITREGKYVGLNTDESGFRLFLERAGIEVRGRTALILGAGGSALAVGAALAHSGARLIIANRTPARAEELRSRLLRILEKAPKDKMDIDNRPYESGKIICTRFAEEDLHSAAAKAELLINTTPVGMTPDVDGTPIAPGWLSRRAIVIDLIYNPEETKLVRGARQLGLRACNGLEMLIHQGALAFSLWTGVEPPAELMRRALADDPGT